MPGRGLPARERPIGEPRARLVVEQHEEKLDERRLDARIIGAGRVGPGRGLRQGEVVKAIDGEDAERPARHRRLVADLAGTDPRRRQVVGGVEHQHHAVAGVQWLRRRGESEGEVGIATNPSVIPTEARDICSWP